MGQADLVKQTRSMGKVGLSWCPILGTVGDSSSIQANQASLEIHFSSFLSVELPQAQMRESSWAHETLVFLWALESKYL